MYYEATWSLWERAWETTIMTIIVLPVLLVSSVGDRVDHNPDILKKKMLLFKVMVHILFRHCNRKTGSSVWPQWLGSFGP